MHNTISRLEKVSKANKPKNLKNLSLIHDADFYLLEILLHFLVH